MNPNKRLLSLDVLRGITVAGMILVNNTGKCGYNYAVFAHAKWDGFSPADLVFPMFMFLMGISTYISLCKYNFQYRSAIAKIIKRSLLLILIGLVIEWFLTAIDSANYFDLSQLRLMGVMQRLGICYGITALLAVKIPHKWFMPLAIVLLAAYFIFQLFGNGFEKSADNIVGMIDSTILGANHMYLQGRQFVDPEGILSTIPAVSQVMIGFVCGKIIIDIKDNDCRMLNLFLIGTTLLFAGYLLSYACPLNKRLWSPSFVLLTCGIAALALALLLYIIDVKQNKKWFSFFEAFGANPLVIYVFSCIVGGLLVHWHIHTAVFNNLFNPLFGNYFGSFMYGVFFLLFNGLLGYVLLKRKIYIKL